MNNVLIRITPDIPQAKSIFKMAKTSIEMIKTIDTERFSSNIIKDYYDVLRELMSIILMLDGYKTYGEGAHKQIIDYIEKNYKKISSSEISLLNELRVLRNKITYDGFFIKKEYVISNENKINSIIKKLEAEIEKRLKI